MQTISITELHAQTARWVRAAKHETVVITDHGKPVATLGPPSKEETKPRPVFTGRDWSQLPFIETDSTITISEDRDGR